MNKHTINYLTKAKKKLGAAIKRLREAEDFVGEFLGAVPPEQLNDDAWRDIPPEYHLLLDSRLNMRGLRQQTFRLLYLLQRVIFLTRNRLSNGEGGTGTELSDELRDMLRRLVDAADPDGERFRTLFREADSLLKKLDEE